MNCPVDQVRYDNMSRLWNTIKPIGRVHPLYGQYMGWSFVSNILVSAETVLAAHSVLAAVDCGNSDTIRTMNYMGKDVIGQLASLKYMSTMGSQADKEPDTFIRSSNILQQASYGLVCITPILPVEFFLPVAGFGNMCATIAFTGFGAINARCIRRLALDDDVGEIYAKVTALNTLGSTIGMAAGIGMVAVIPDHATRMCLIPVLGIGRFYTYNWAIRGLVSCN